MINNLFKLNPLVESCLKHPTSMLVKPLSADLSLDFNKIIKFYNREYIDFLAQYLKQQDWKQVSVTGYESTNNPVSEMYTGSKRCTAMNYDIADGLWNAIKPIIPPTREFNENDPDIDGCTRWRPIGVNPLLRFMKYERGSLLVPHYDAPYTQDSCHKTFTTLVIYLTDNKTGATRLIEGRDDTFKDWERLPTNQEIKARIEPLKGVGIMFDHRVLHDSELLEDDEDKIILRTDIIYKKEM